MSGKFSPQMAYGINGRLDRRASGEPLAFATVDGVGVYNAYSLTDMKKPSDTPMFADRTLVGDTPPVLEGVTAPKPNPYLGVFVNYAYTRANATAPLNPAAATSDYPAIRHNGGANLAFCDGHAKWYKQESALVYSENSPIYWDPAGR